LKIKKREYYIATVCDLCGTEIPDTWQGDECFICGKDVCVKCSVGVRGFDDRIVCSEHLNDANLVNKMLTEEDEV